MRLAPTENCGVVGNDERVEAIARAAGLEGLQDQSDDVGAERIHLAVELDAGDSITKIDQRGFRNFS